MTYTKPQLYQRGLNCGCLAILILCIVSVGAYYFSQFIQGDAKREPTVVFVTGKSVNLRDGPGTTHAVVGGVTRGDSLTIMGEKDEWLQAQLGDGSNAWIHGSLTGTRQAAEAAKPVIIADDEPPKDEPSSTTSAKWSCEYREVSIGTVRSGDDATPVSSLQDLLRTQPDCQILGVRYQKELGNGVVEYLKVFYDREKRVLVRLGRERDSTSDDHRTWRLWHDAGPHHFQSGLPYGSTLRSTSDARVRGSESAQEKLARRYDGPEDAMSWP